MKGMEKMILNIYKNY